MAILSPVGEAWGVVLIAVIGLIGIPACLGGYLLLAEALVTTGPGVEGEDGVVGAGAGMIGAGVGAKGGAVGA